MRTKHSLLVLLITAEAAAVGCSNQNKVVGLTDWKEVVRATDDVMFRADTASLLRHMDFSGIPRAKSQNLETGFQAWRGVWKNLKFDRMEVIEAKDFKLPPGCPALLWGKPPQKIIVYHYSRPNGASTQWSFAVYERESQWYFTDFENESQWFFTTSYQR
jgi:hypothetical protein